MTIVAVVLYVLGGAMMAMWAFDSGRDILRVRVVLCVLGWPIVIVSSFIIAAHEHLEERLQ